MIEPASLEELFKLIFRDLKVLQEHDDDMGMLLVRIEKRISDDLNALEERIVRLESRCQND
jgi:hypothetical protein